MTDSDEYLLSDEIEPEPQAGEALAFAGILSLIMLPKSGAAGSELMTLLLILLRFLGLLFLGTAISYIWNRHMNVGHYFKLRNRYVILGFAGLVIFLCSIVMQIQPV